MWWDQGRISPGQSPGPYLLEEPMSVRDHMDPALFLEVLYVAAQVKTPEEKARVAWRASDYVWWNFPRYPVGFCRDLNDYLKDQKLPMVKPLFSEEERRAYFPGFETLFPLQTPGDSSDSPSEEQHLRTDNGTGDGEVPTNT